jgi:hypothetical protein
MVAALIIRRIKMSDVSYNPQVREIDLDDLKTTCQNTFSNTFGTLISSKTLEVMMRVGQDVQNDLIQTMTDYPDDYMFNDALNNAIEAHYIGSNLMDSLDDDNNQNFIDFSMNMLLRRIMVEYNRENLEKEEFDDLYRV